MIELSFVLIGAQKAATTWLFERLRSHPDLAFPGRKNDQEYFGRTWDSEEDQAAYARRFEDAVVPFVGDAAVDAMFDPAVAPFLAERIPDVQVIASLRDPFDRAVSAHGWNVRKGRYPDLPLDDVLELAVGLQLQSFAAEPSMAQRLRQLVDRGRYAKQMQRFVASLGPERVCVVLYDEIQHAPEAALERVTRFFGADPSKLGAPSTRRPKRATRSRHLTRLQRLAPDFGPLGRLVEVLNEWTPDAKGEGTPATISPVVRERFVSALRPDVHELRELLATLPPTHRPTMDLQSAWPAYFESGA